MSDQGPSNEPPSAPPPPPPPPPSSWDDPMPPPAAPAADWSTTSAGYSTDLRPCPQRRGQHRARILLRHVHDEQRPTAPRLGAQAEDHRRHPRHPARHLGIHSFYLGNSKKGIIQIVVIVFTCGLAASGGSSTAS